MLSGLLVTGANGHLGRRLISSLPPEVAVTAVVRSERAEQTLRRHLGERQRVEIVIADPSDAEALKPLAARAQCAVHLLGSIRAANEAALEDSHQRPCAALLDAAADSPLSHIVYVSILGAAPDSHSACLRARAAVEKQLSASPQNTTVIRVPMVLGERDRASLALARRARQAHTIVFRGSSLEQPIYAGDVINALQNLISNTHRGHACHELAGPESLARDALIRRAAVAMGKPAPHVYSLPLAFGLLAAGVMEYTMKRPPVTRDMLRILDHDDHINCSAVTHTLGIQLTTLDEMLERCIRHRLEKSA